MLVKAVTQHPLVKRKYSQYACNYLQNGMRKILMANFLCIYYTFLCYSTSRKHFECAKMEEQGQIVKSVGYVAGQNVCHLPLTLISWVISACSLTRVHNSAGWGDVIYYNKFSKHGHVYKESSFLDIGKGHHSLSLLISWNRKQLNMTHRNKFQKLLHIHIHVSLPITTFPELK